MYFGCILTKQSVVFGTWNWFCEYFGYLECCQIVIWQSRKYFTNLKRVQLYMGSGPPNLCTFEPHLPPYAISTCQDVMVVLPKFKENSKKSQNTQK